MKRRDEDAVSSLSQRTSIRSMRIQTCCAARSRTWCETLFVTPPREQPSRSAWNDGSETRGKTLRYECLIPDLKFLKKLWTKYSSLFTVSTTRATARLAGLDWGYPSLTARFACMGVACVHLTVLRAV